MLSWVTRDAALGQDQLDVRWAQAEDVVQQTAWLMIGWKPMPGIGSRLKGHSVSLACLPF
jgi:hypothetical protein